jgi:hypothetical protein
MIFQDDHEHMGEILEAAGSLALQFLESLFPGKTQRGWAGVTDTDVLWGEARYSGSVCQLVDVRAGYSCHT